MSALDWPALAPDVAAALERGPLADRPRRDVREHGGQTVRYGRRGSLRLTVTGPAAGTWTDHEAGASGGVLALLIHLGAADSARAAADWLRQHGVDPPESPHRPPNGAPPARSTPTDQHRRPARPGAPTGGLDRRALAALAASEAIPPAPDHPARRWLAARALWRPDVDLPPWLRWLPAEALAAVAGAVPAGDGMAGAIVAPVAPLAAWIHAAADADWPRSAVTGCQLVNVAPDGSPAADAGGLGKRSYDRMAGGVAVAGLIEPRDGVTVGEGLADALALASRYRPAAIATLGTSGLVHPATTAALAALPGGVTVYPDADQPTRGPDGRLRRAGPAAADGLQAAIERHGGRLRRADLPAGCDAAALAALDGFPDVDAADLGAYRRIFEADGLPAWECGRLAYVTALDNQAPPAT